MFSWTYLDLEVFDDIDPAITLPDHTAIGFIIEIQLSLPCPRKAVGMASGPMPSQPLAISYCRLARSVTGPV